MELTTRLRIRRARLAVGQAADDRRRRLDLDRQRRLGSHQEQRVISRLTSRERSLEAIRSQIRSIRVELSGTCQLAAVALLRALGD